MYTVSAKTGPFSGYVVSYDVVTMKEAKRLANESFKETGNVSVVLTRGGAIAYTVL